MATRAGHDIDYIAIGGALWPLGRAGSAPVPPLNLVGDFGGGGMLLAFGMVSALLESSRSGQGQVVDAAMVDGAASLMTMVHSFHEAGMWNEERGANLLDSGAPFYEVYETSDGKYFAVGGLESKFYDELLEGMGLADDPSSSGATRTTRPTGRPGKSATPRCSPPGRGTSGRPSSTGPMPARSRSCRRGRPTCIRTTRRVRPSWKLTARYSRRRRRVSAAPPRPSPSHRRTRERTRCPGWSSGVSMKKPWPNCGKRAR